MNNDIYEVLVIDDNSDYAKTLARYIEKTCRVKATYAVKPEEAEEILNNNPLKVIVFDQRMPLMNGTVLYQHLRNLNSYFLAMLLTADASSAEICDAIEMGFNVVMMKEKDDYLVSFKVLSLIHDYYEKLNSSNKYISFFQVKIGGLFSKDRIDYSIVSFQIVDPCYVANESWCKLSQISAGEGQKLITRQDAKAQIRVTKTQNHLSRLDLSGLLSIPNAKFAEFKSAFSDLVEKTITNEQVYMQSLTNEHTWTLELPATGNVLYKRFEVAPVFKKLRVFVKSSFSWTNKTYIDCIEVVLPTELIACRLFITYYDRNEYVDLGVFRE